MRSKEQINEIVRRLEEAYPLAECALEYGKDYELLFAVRLSAQCTDARVNMVTPALYERFPTLESFAEASESEVGEYIHSCGFFRTKAKDIVECAKLLIRDYGGRVPDSMEELLKLPGVGRKTASVVLSNAFDIPAIAVDTHVFRVSNRIGLAEAPNVEKTEQQLMAQIPRDTWSIAHHWLIWHGRRVCSARNPACQTCTLRDLCQDYQKRHGADKPEEK